MNWLSKIFKDTKSENTTGEDIVLKEEADNAFLEKIFKDDTEPETIPEPVKSKNPLTNYLNDDFHIKGYEDGYRHNCLDKMESKIKLIKSDFRYQVDILIGEERLKKSAFEKALISMDGIKNRHTEKLEHSLRSAKNIIERLEEQKVLSAEGEGLVMKAINQYEDGFLEGTKDYHEEELFLKS